MDFFTCNAQSQRGCATCDVAVRVGARAMVPPLLFFVPPAMLDNYRLRMRQHCAIPNVLDRTRCLACRNPRTASAPGECEHVKTGVCEACWDLLVADTESSNRSPSMHSFGRTRHVATWISINRVAPGGTLTCVEPLARHIIAVGTGRENPPNFWVAGERP